MLRGAKAFYTTQSDEVRFIAAMLGVPTTLMDDLSGTVAAQQNDKAKDSLEAALGQAWYENPFDGSAMSPLETVELCGFWRRLIDSNRDLGGGLGFAFWKQQQVGPLLWNGSGEFPFLRNIRDVQPGRHVAIWRARTPATQIKALENARMAVAEVEDGFLRSQGLGADCVPPLSITVDRQGAYFDPRQASELEDLLEHGRFDAVLKDRARRLREAIVDAGLSKYESGAGPSLARRREAPHILVPGQVEDDRAVQIGGCGLISNLELLKKVRAGAPDAHLIYKPHPDVLAGHRRGAIPDRAALEFADEISIGESITSLIELVDEVHVNTSLAGFEALVHGKAVATYGVPFYAGWGLTRDHGPVPTRRTARRSVEELIAATLLLYPRYIDPVTGLPCPAEVVVDRLSTNPAGNDGPIVQLRRLQGRVMRRLRSVVQ